MKKFGVKLLFVTFFEMILTLMAAEITGRTSSLMDNIPPAVLVILTIELIISIYYMGYLGKNETIQDEDINEKQ